MKLYVDENYIIEIRREIHRFPEIGYDLPKTVALVKRELTAMGLTYTEKYGKSSVVSYITPEKYTKTIALRADMDALPVEEKTDLPFKSEIKGHMHACGHDAHTACLLGAAKALCSIKDSLNVRVKLIFQPDEEGVESAAYMLCKNGVMRDADEIIALHVDNSLESGKIGICPGPAMASARNFMVEFFGKTAHAAAPHTGADAICAAVKLYNGVHLSLARGISPLEKHVFSIGEIHGGKAQNVVADYSYVVGTIRAYSSETDLLIFEKLNKAAEYAAGETGCTFKITSSQFLPPVINDKLLSEEVLSAAGKLVGKENTVIISQRMGSEDYADYLTEKPGVLFRLGTWDKNLPKTSSHGNNFVIDEKALKFGAEVMVRYVIEKSVAKYIKM